MRTLLLFAIFATQLAAFPARVARTGSMEPTLHGGEVIYVNDEVKFSELKVGDIVVFRNPLIRFGLIVHRTVKLTKYGWITKGDANDRCDKGVMYEESYVGRVNVLLRVPAK